jgi:NtrC-family two-component system response regulator AlgB
MSRRVSILVVDDEAGIRHSLRLYLERGDAHAVDVATGAAALEALERHAFDVVLLDLWLEAESGLDVLRAIQTRRPRMPVVIMTAEPSLKRAVEAMKLGAADYLPKPFAMDQVRETLDRAILSREPAPPPPPDAADAVGAFGTASPAFASLLAIAKRAAPTDCVVLLRGESGTGKTVLAELIHRHSRRNKGRFVTVNCPALSSDLMISTLFGHQKGAFTSAVRDATGKVQDAERGTLFLDEIGDLGLEPQARILRFLNDRTYERLGESRERRADVRLVAATNRPLEEYVQQGRFREDLFYRLKVVTLVLPPLRERQQDVRPLAGHYLTLSALRAGRGPLTFSQAAQRRILSYTWPGNLRELHNTVERVAILAEGPEIEPEDLDLPDSPEKKPGGESAGVAVGDDTTIEEIERAHVARVLARAPTFEAAAKILGITRATLQRKRERYGLL